MVFLILGVLLMIYCLYTWRRRFGEREKRLLEKAHRSVPMISSSVEFYESVSKAMNWVGVGVSVLLIVYGFVAVMTS